MSDPKNSIGYQLSVISYQLSSISKYLDKMKYKSVIFIVPPAPQLPYASAPAAPLLQKDYSRQDC